MAVWNRGFVLPGLCSGMSLPAWWNVINVNTCVFGYFSTGQALRCLSVSFRIDHDRVAITVDQISDVL